KFSDRSKTPIEPYLSDQWFVKMGDLPAPPPEGPGKKPGLAQMAMDAVTQGRVKFFPERYAKSYLDWLGEKRDWCISRQLWWGHRIPIWYARCSEADLHRAFAGRNDVAWRFDEGSGQWLICALTDDVLAPHETTLAARQDPDVLDTWFSSMLWPHSTLGWPENTPELQYYYPTSTLVTSRDIITLWVARMVLASLYNLGEVPFREVYITVKLLDGFGETMSKSKGNGVDPLDIIARYGADALRFVVVQMSSETQDARLPVANACPHCDVLVPVKPEHMYMRTRKVTCPSCKQPFRPGGPWPSDDPELKTAKQASERFEQGRNFANKIWNAARFILMNLDGYTPQALNVAALPIEDRWILSRLATTTKAVTESLEAYRFSDVARTIYDFVWSEFCDWYVEMAKGRLKHGPGVKGQESETSAGPGMSTATPEYGRDVAQRVLVGVLDGIVRLVHPIMPFVAEAIWQTLNEAAFERGLPSPEPATESVVIAAWPEYPAAWHDAAIERRLARMQELVRAVREVRNRYQVDPKTHLDVLVRTNNDVAADLRLLAPFIRQLAGVARFETGADVAKPSQAASYIGSDFEAYVSLSGLIDVAAELKRLEKKIAEKRKQLQGARAKLDNPNFRDKAPTEIVQQQREQTAELEKQLQALEANRRELASA
ncbi:MAG: class I tRNA ligase family protein, partial [Gemmataceae bacterium]|nr:class I tRNA ligase family protein [Gemmataceae bacterium]